MLNYDYHPQKKNVRHIIILYIRISERTTIQLNDHYYSIIIMQKHELQSLYSKNGLLFVSEDEST